MMSKERAAKKAAAMEKFKKEQQVIMAYYPSTALAVVCGFGAAYASRRLSQAFTYNIFLGLACGGFGVQAGQAMFGKKDYHEEYSPEEYQLLKE